MHKSSLRFLWVSLSILTIILTACTPQVQAATGITEATSLPANTPTAVSFSDPFAYCAAVGTIDTPDARYTGVQVPEEIINGFKVAAGLQDSTEPMDMFQKTTIWRCMDSKVYACNYGANLPCSSKANTDKTPTQAMNDYCSANPDSDFIPMSVTGHSTIYSWHCVKDTPELLDQIENVDAQGYLQQIWYAIDQYAATSPTSAPAATENPVEAPASATGEAIQPLIMEVCDGEAQAMEHALDVMEVTQSDAPLTDPVSNLSGTGCMSTVTGSGEKFTDPTSVITALESMLVDEGWARDPSLDSNGPTSIGAGYRKGDQICLATAGWEPDASANCPQDQPVTACQVKPEQQNYTITLNFGVESQE